jgi:hypothetical protein
MKRMYKTGADSNVISFELKISTVGVAYTAVYQAWSGGQYVKLKESTLVGNGKIPKFNIGISGDLKGSYIVPRTIIDLGHLNEADRKRELELLSAKYIFGGGLTGNQIFNLDSDDKINTPENKIIVITKPIELL